MLARHPDVYTLPETAFFQHLHADVAWRWGDRHIKPRRRPLRARLGMPRKGVRQLLMSLHYSLCGEHTPHLRAPFSTSACAAKFVSMLDMLADQADCSTWIEKTPNHLLYIPEITASVPDARFIHVVRPGPDVLASLADALLSFDNDLAFGGGSVLWARRWNHAMHIHEAYLGQPNHTLVFLEDLIQRPEREWKRICRFLDLEPDTHLAAACNQSIADLDHEPWKHAAISGLPQKLQPKVDDLFGPKFQCWLQDHLESYDSLRAKSLFRQNRYGESKVTPLGSQRPVSILSS